MRRRECMRESCQLAPRDTVTGMSERNGDKSRYQINRKRAVLRRAKLRAASPAEPGAPKRFAKAKTTRPK